MNEGFVRFWPLKVVGSVKDRTRAFAVREVEYHAGQ